MKLSQVLKDWPEKRAIPKGFLSKEIFTKEDIDGMSKEGIYNLGRFDAHNTALTSCDREIDREALAKVIGEVQSCPNPDCGDKGWYVGETTTREYVTRDMALDAGDKTLEGSVYREAEQEQVQCEFCYTNSLSKFNLADHIIATMPTWLKRIEDK